jgi:hypothetical protein
VNSSEPAAPVRRLEALQCRIARSAVYFHPFESGSLPFRVPAGVTCAHHIDAGTATAYIRLANGNRNAAAYGATEGYSIRLPDTVEAVASGSLVSVNVIARAADGARSWFALAYSTNEVGNSGWHWIEAGPEWEIFTFEYSVPVMKDGNGDFIGIIPDSAGSSGTEFCFLSVNTGGSPEFPGELFDYDWYADAYADLQLPRDVPRETRYTQSLQHYLKYGRRQRRDPNALFSSKWYVDRFQVPADVDPLVHYAQHETSGQVSPNRWWEFLSKQKPASGRPPSLWSRLFHYPVGRRPTYIIGIFGSGRMYLTSLVLHTDPEVAYYYRGEWRHYLGNIPVILSGHVTSMYEGAFCDRPDYGRVLLERAAAGLINLVFVYRHPLDSLLSNWVWFRKFLRQEKPASGIAASYKTEADLHRDLSENFDEFCLFCEGSKDFARVATGTSRDWRFLSLLEFIHETEVFLSSANVHAFRFEDFQIDAATQFKRFASILAPDLPPKLDQLPAPQAASSRYLSARENVSAFRAKIDSLPTHITKRIVALGYSV